MIERKAHLVDASRSLDNKLRLTFEFDSLDSADGLDGDLRITIKKWKNQRSGRANRALWACIGEIAAAIRADKWEIYLQMLKRYGKFTYICIRPDAAEMFKRGWRECEEIGEVEIGGEKAIQLLCYYGSSLYDTAEFARLLDGVIDEMRNLGLPIPLTEEDEQLLEQWRNG